MFRNRFGDCTDRVLSVYVTTSHVAFSFNHVHASVGTVETSLGRGLIPSSHCASAPATCGAAIDVPDSFSYVDVFEGSVDR